MTIGTHADVLDSKLGLQSPFTFKSLLIKSVFQWCFSPLIQYSCFVGNIQITFDTHYYARSCLPKTQMQGGESVLTVNDSYPSLFRNAVRLVFYVAIAKWVILIFKCSCTIEFCPVRDPRYTLICLSSLFCCLVKTVCSTKWQMRGVFGWPDWQQSLFL